MSTDTRTPAEIAYDSLKDGSAYARQAVEPVDEEAQVTELLEEIEAYSDQKRKPSGLLLAVADFIAPYKAELPSDAVRVEQQIGDADYSDQHIGETIADRFFAGGVELFVPRPGIEMECPQVFMLGREGVPIAEVEAVLPHLQALLSDSRVQAARAAWEQVGFIPYIEPELEQDTPLSDTERQVIGALYPNIPIVASRGFNDDDKHIIETLLVAAQADDDDLPIVRSRDQAHREERWLSILEQVAEMDEDEQGELLGYMTGLLAGVRLGRPAA
jgi:hypothetical protein